MAARLRLDGGHEDAGQRVDRSFLSVPLSVPLFMPLFMPGPGYQMNRDTAMIGGDNGNRVPLQALVTRRSHLQLCRKVDPELEDLQRTAIPPEGVRRQLRMDEAASGCHPLHAAGMDDALVPGGVTVGEIAFQDECDRLEPAMRVRAEREPLIAGPVGLRAVMVEEEERTKAVQSRAGEWAAGDEIGDVIAQCRMQAHHGSGAGHDPGPLLKAVVAVRGRRHQRRQGHLKRY
jgi:hypothetical protein